jgi:hypothetical protein
MRFQNRIRLVAFALWAALAVTGCARNSIPTTAPAEAPPVDEFHLYDAPAEQAP